MTACRGVREPNIVHSHLSIRLVQFMQFFARLEIRLTTDVEQTAYAWFHRPYQLCAELDSTAFA